MPPDICDLEVSIHYRKREMLKTTVRAPRLQLHYHSEAPELEAHHYICFPPTDSLLDHKQVPGGSIPLSVLVWSLTSKLSLYPRLNTPTASSTASRKDSSWKYGTPVSTPWGRTGVTCSLARAIPVWLMWSPVSCPRTTWWSSSALLSMCMVGAVPGVCGKKKPSAFCRICCCWASCLWPELKLFKENNGGSPEYTINMCFGEKFPDGKALEKKLVTVKVRLLWNFLPSEMHKEFNPC